jgi:hypothetical protein
MIRYNSTLASFEGYAASAWASLGGVKSVDGFTFIIAETSASASNGDLDFYAENSAGTGSIQVGQWNRTNLKDYTGTLVGTQTTQNLFNVTATTVNAFGAATTLSIGAATGTLTINNANTVITGNLTVNGTTTTVNSTTVEIQNAFVFEGATADAFETTLSTVDPTADRTILLPNASDTLVGKATTDTLTNKSINLTSNTLTATSAQLATAITDETGTGVIVFGTSPTLTTSVVAGSASMDIFNTTATTVNAYGAATTLAIGNATAATLTLRPGTVVGSNTTQNLYNTVATTLNIGGAATTVSIGASTGTLTLNNANTVITGNLTINGTTTTVNSSTVNLDNTILQLGGDTVPTVDDNQDRGVAFRWFSGSAKNGFFGFDDSTGFFTFIPDTTITSGVAAGTVGVIDALRITGSAATLTTARNINGTAFDGSAAITTASWGTARTITLGGTGKSVDGSVAVTWTIPEIIPTNTSIQLGSIGVGTAASGVAGEIRATGTVTGYYSDDRLKTRTGNIENALEKVLSLDGFHYHANETAAALGYDSSKQEIGLSAQQVQAVLPEIVVPAPIDATYLTIHYERMIPLLVEAIKEQQKQIEELKAKLGN